MLGIVDVSSTERCRLRYARGPHTKQVNSWLGLARSGCDAYEFEVRRIEQRADGKVPGGTRCDNVLSARWVGCTAQLTVFLRDTWSDWSCWRNAERFEVAGSTRRIGRCADYVTIYPTTSELGCYDVPVFWSVDYSIAGGAYELGNK